jgi:hypothetical protein
MPCSLIKPLAIDADAGILGISANFLSPWHQTAANARNFYMRTT